MVVYVTEQGAEVTKQGERLVVRRGREVLRALRLGEVTQLALMGHVSLTPAAIRELLRRQIDTVLLTMGGSFVGRLTTGLSANVKLRVLQHRRLADEGFALETAKRLVSAKVHNQRRLLLRAQRGSADVDVARVLVRMRHSIESVGEATTLDELRGTEGNAAALYFSVLGKLITAPGVTFTKRVRRPPPDPVNVLLSFGYTMLTNLMSGLCEQAGFDPHVGALHAIENGRPSLALDLIEEQRALIVDTAALTAINRRHITPADFIAPDLDDADIEDAWAEDDQAGGEPVADRKRVVFRREGVLKWVTAMERRLEERVLYAPRGEQLSYRQVMREQVFRFARYLEGSDDYQGFEGPS